MKFFLIFEEPEGARSGVAPGFARREGLVRGQRGYYITELSEDMNKYFH